MPLQRLLAVSALVSCALPLCAASRDSTRLASRLLHFRQYQTYELSAAEYEPIRGDYVAWLDRRVHSRIAVSEMNEELKASKLISEGPQDIDDYFDKTYVGFLGGISTVDISGAKDVIGFALDVYTGRYCNEDQTIVIYDRSSLTKIAQINAQRSYSHGYFLRTLAVGSDSATNGRIIASGWVASNCTSNWNGEMIRIDVAHSHVVENVLAQGVSGFAGEDMKIGVDDRTATFDWATASGESEVMIRRGLAIYRVESGHAVRVAPIATSLGGFIDEWLTMDASDAARWATPEAANRHYEIAAKFERNTLDWRLVTECKATTPTREVTARVGNSDQSVTFRVLTSTAAQMRMISISDAVSSDCQEIATPEILPLIYAELP